VFENAEKTDDDEEDEDENKSTENENKEDIHSVHFTASSEDECKSVEYQDSFIRRKKRQKKKNEKKTVNLRNEYDDDDEEEEERSEFIYLYMEMELCRSDTLRHWLKRSDRSHQDIFAIFEQIVNAIAYIHSQDLIHRDLKPSNILLSLDGNRVKIGDFGLVVSVEENLINKINSALEVNTNTINCNTNPEVSAENNGTYLYMSPEQLRHYEYSSKVDIFSLGIILYELVVSFETEMERCETLKNLHKNKFSEKFINEYPIEKNLVAFLIEPVPNKRPTANEILSSNHFQEFKAAYTI